MPIDVSSSLLLNWVCRMKMVCGQCSMRILRMCFAQIRWFVPVSGFQNLVIMLKVVEQHLFLTVCAAVASVYPLCLSCNNAILRTCDREYEKHECHPAEGYNRRSSSISSKHWADRDNEVMDFKAVLDWEDDDEATGSKGMTLFKVTEKTEKFLTVVFSSGVPNTARCQWRFKYGASNTKPTSCPNLDKVMKSRLPAVTKSRDRLL